MPNKLYVIILKNDMVNALSTHSDSQKLFSVTLLSMAFANDI